MTYKTEWRVALDIGHARGTGASGNGLKEHEVCTRVAALLMHELAAHKIVADVVDFPERSNSADLAATAKAINAGDFDLSVSLHCDASSNALAKGAHVIYTSEKGRIVAGQIAKHLCPLMPGRANRTVKRGDLYILNNTRCPAVLVECGFVTNREDADMLTNGVGAIAHSISVGIREALPLLK